MSVDCDILVVGGGVNGCGIARDAIGRGYSVALCEMNDLGWATSSGSTKLIHGGLRYLEFYEFLLVRKALGEREVLWALAPHIIQPMRLVLPHQKGLRPAWLLRLGLFVYDHIGGRNNLPVTRTLDLTVDIAGKPLKPLFTKGFEFSDCRVDDSRLVVLNALDAAERGADIKTRTRLVSAEKVSDHWQVDLEDTATGKTQRLTTRIIVNSAGPWVDKVLAQSFGNNNAQNVRLVQGSHIVVKKLFDHDRCYFFQNGDGRIIFAIPYLDHYTLIGTTDLDYAGDPADVKCTPQEISYLCECASEYFIEPVLESDVVWTYSAVRPLFDDGASAAQEATRDYVLRCDGDENAPQVINIFGGKITTYRVLAEAVLDKIEKSIGAKKSTWTDQQPLPGGDFPIDGFEQLVRQTKNAYPFLADAQVSRMCHAYGTRISKLLGDARKIEDLGKDFGAGLYELEVEYLIEYEWVRSGEDVLWRRSKLGLAMSKKQQKALDSWMARKFAT